MKVIFRSSASVAVRLIETDEMKTLLITIILIFPLYLFSQEAKDTLLIKKWYYCDSVTKPDKLVNTMLFYSDPDATRCEPNNYVFYWEFKGNGKYEWSDTTHNSQHNIVDGLTVIPSSNWKFKNDILYIGEKEFIIDVLNKDRLLIHRREE